MSTMSTVEYKRQRKAALKVIRAQRNGPSFNQVLSDAARKSAREQRERVRKAGKHKCLPIAIGSIRRLTGRNGVRLKRPVVTLTLRECKICGRTMP